MSDIEYNDLLFEISERLDELNVRERLIFMCRGKLASGSEYSIQDALSLFKELEERDCLGPDRLEVVKDVLKRFKEWVLFGKVKTFQSKRKEYIGLLEHIIAVLDELNDLERLISICKGKIPEANEGNIHDVRSLFKELENHNCLGIDYLGILKEILTQTEQSDLLKEVDKFEERRNREDEFQTRKGICNIFSCCVILFYHEAILINLSIPGTRPHIQFAIRIWHSAVHSQRADHCCYVYNLSNRTINISQKIELL